MALSLMNGFRDGAGELSPGDTEGLHDEAVL